MNFFRYVSAAFNARPWGMWLAPNWVGVAAFAMLVFVHPGFLVLGAGLEAAYLLCLTSSARFRRIVDLRSIVNDQKTSQQQIVQRLARLDPSDQTRYHQLEQRCQSMLNEQHDSAAVDLQTQADGLGKLLFVYLRLLLTRTTILRVLQGSGPGAAGGPRNSIDLRIDEVTRQLQNSASPPTPELQHSLSDQLNILQERKKRQAEARQKLEFIEAELTRIEEQVELIRESFAVSSDAAGLSRKIDQVGDTLGTTSQWLKQQQELLGTSEDLLNDPPPVALQVPNSARATA